MAHDPFKFTTADGRVAVLSMNVGAALRAAICCWDERPPESLPEVGSHIESRLFTKKEASNDTQEMF